MLHILIKIKFQNSNQIIKFNQIFQKWKYFSCNVISQILKIESSSCRQIIRENNQCGLKMFISFSLLLSLSLSESGWYVLLSVITNGPNIVDRGRKRVYRHLAGFRECKLGVSCTYRTKCSIRWSFFTRPIDNAIANTLYVLG